MKIGKPELSVVHTPSIPALRQRQADLFVGGQPGLQKTNNRTARATQKDCPRGKKIEEIWEPLGNREMQAGKR